MRGAVVQAERGEAGGEGVGEAGGCCFVGSGQALEERAAVVAGCEAGLVDDGERVDGSVFGHAQWRLRL